MITFLDRNTKWVVLTGVILLIVLTSLSQTSWLGSLENLSLDLRFMLRGALPFPSNITVIGIDEPSLDALGHWPWSRDKHASFLQLLRNPPFRPAALGYDILFEHADTLSLESDKAFADQAVGFDNDLVLVYFFEKGVAVSVEEQSKKESHLEHFALPPSDDIPEKLEEMNKFSAPYDELLRTELLGFANNPIDSDGRTRRMRLLIRHNGRVYPSFTLLLAIKLLGAHLSDVEVRKNSVIIKTRQGKEKIIPIISSGDMFINYWGTFREIPKYSFLEILREGQAWMNQNQDPVKLKSLKGKLAVVGATALGLEDRRVTPFHAYEPATSVQAQAIADIVEGKFLRRPSGVLSIAVSIFLGILVILLTATQRALRAFIFIFLSAIAYIAIAYAAFLNDVWLGIADPLTTMAVLFVALVCVRYFLTAEELKKTYAQLLRAEKMASLGTLSASIAHEYRNFLSSISMAAEVCQMEGIGKEKFEQCLNIILTTVRKANQVSQALLTFARKQESVKQEAQLAKTIEEVMLITGKDLEQNNIKVEKELAAIGPLQYDEGQISQVLMNMVRNSRDALQYRNEDKKIVIRLNNAGKYVLLEIEDNGCGIPKKVLDRLFEPFTTSKKEGEGTGLGLSVCHGIIRNHGGEIKVKTQENQGTTWQIYLPKK